MTTTPPFDRRSGDSLVQVIASKLEDLHGDVGGMKAVLKELTAAVTKLAVIEERQGQASLAMERMFVLVERMEVRIRVLEVAAPAAAQTSSWMVAGIGAVGAVIVTIIAKKLGLV